jgi:AcrR family transcriptional regulator
MSRVREAGMEDRILDSAFRVFGEYGYQATTLKQIASGAGISSGSVYTYFPDKESLFKAAVNRGWGGFIDEVEAINRSLSRRDERIGFLIDRGFSTLGQALPLIRGMLFEASKQNLVAHNVDRLCLAISCLFKPDEGDPLRPAWEASMQRFILISRIIVLGVLTSAAFLPSASPTGAIDSLKEAIRALMASTGVILGEGAQIVLPGEARP